jgi:hybrid cluster-associated redox disulfide protein
MTEAITKSDNLANIFNKYPSTMKVFIKNKMRCFACELNAFATVEECCRNHKVKDPDSFVLMLNESRDEDLHDE